MHRFFLWLFGFHPRFKKQDVRRKTDLLRFKFPYFSNIFPVDSKLFPNFFSSTNCLFFVSHRSLILFKFPSIFNVCQDHRSLVDGLMMLILLFEEMRSSLCLPDIESWTLFWSINFCRVNVKGLIWMRENWEMSLNFNICLKFMQFVEQFPNYF